MKNYLLILPIALLVTYSQLIAKWRVIAVPHSVASGFSGRLFQLLIDPVMVSAYTAGLIASFAWLYVVTKLPLTVAFPVYMGTTFIMVLMGGWFFLGESLTIAKIVAVILILAGIILGITANA